MPLDILLPSIEEDMFLRGQVDWVVTISTAVALVDLSLFCSTMSLDVRKISRSEVNCVPERVYGGNRRT